MYIYIYLPHIRCVFVNFIELYWIVVSESTTSSHILYKTPWLHRGEGVEHHCDSGSWSRSGYFKVSIPKDCYLHSCFNIVLCVCHKKCQEIVIAGPSVPPTCRQIQTNIITNMYIYILNTYTSYHVYIPVKPHEAVAEVSKIENL